MVVCLSSVSALFELGDLCCYGSNNKHLVTVGKQLGLYLKESTVGYSLETTKNKQTVMSCVNVCLPIIHLDLVLLVAIVAL